MTTSTTVAVIGGGASGMAAALSAARGGKTVTLFERQPRVGRKLSVTGNGRCNLGNTNLSAAHYHGADGAFVEPALGAFDTRAALAFFKQLGLLTVTEADGRVYPLSDQAGSVVDVLRLAVQEAGVCVRTESEVTAIRRGPDGFTVCTQDAQTQADAVIVCCGGVAGGKFGGGRSGYELLASLGHSVTKLYPSLVQIKTETGFVGALKGVRADGRVWLTRGAQTLAESAGEIQFADFGVSGPAIFEISRAASVESGRLTLHIDTLREYARDETERILIARRASMADLSCENFLTGILHNRLGRTLLRYGGYNLAAPIGSLSAADIAEIAGCCKDFALAVTGTPGFDGAQVTAGGARTAEFDPATLQSRLVPGLYAAGEVLDVDGDCGGYNLQWAWASGSLAGQTRGR